MAQPTPPLAACQGGAVVVAGQRGAGDGLLAYDNVNHQDSLI